MTIRRRSLGMKLATCTFGLKEWSNLKYGHMFKELKKKIKKLSHLNKGRLTQQQMAQQRVLIKDITSLVHLEEVYWRHRSRDIWLCEGDKILNSSINECRTVEGLTRLQELRMMIDDMIHEGDDEVGLVAVNYLKNLFSTSAPPRIEESLLNFDARARYSINVGLSVFYTTEDVRIALSKMHPIKASVPYGTYPLFFQSYWHVVGHTCYFYYA